MNPFTDFDTFEVVRGNSGRDGNGVFVFASPGTLYAQDSPAGSPVDGQGGQSVAIGVTSNAPPLASSSANGKVLTTLPRGALVTAFNKHHHYGQQPNGQAFEKYDKQGRTYIETVVGHVRGWVVRKYSPYHDKSLFAAAGGTKEARADPDAVEIEYLRYIKP